MAAPGKAPNGGSSRWGSFLSQAVAGVESRLDNMLGEAEDGQPGGTGSQAQAQTQGQGAAAAPTTKQPAPTAQLTASKPSPAASRSSSNNRTNDRLQARLAKAMVGKNAQGASASSPRSSVDQASRSSTEQPSADKDQADAGGDVLAENAAPATNVDDVARDTPDVAETASVEGAAGDAANKTSEAAERPDIFDTEETSDGDARPKETGQPAQSAEQGPSIPAPPKRDNMAQLSRDVEEIKTRQQEEIQEYVERIDSLQAKLQYLSKNAAEAAKKEAAAAPSGSTEKKMAEKDEKIALLMEEGQKLSSTEHKLRMMIKKLRAQMGDLEKQFTGLKDSNANALAEAEKLRGQLNGSEEKEKRQEEVRRTTANLQKEIDSLRKDKADKTETVRRLEQEMKTKLEQAEMARLAAVDKAVAAERQKQRELENTITMLRDEKSALNDKSRQENLEWKEKHERVIQRGQTMENELKTELRAMEGKLESMRSAAEEASSASGGEAQVKLLRQIETLQSQYASASDNWQGIETSLLAKVANVEKERDEAQRRESEMRKKARDAASRNRHLEEELEDVKPAHATVQQELESCREQLATLRTSAKSTESALEQARADLEKQQRTAAREDAAEAERRQWVDDVGAASPRAHSRPESPLMSITRTFSSDLMAAASSQGKSRRALTPASAAENMGDGLGLSQGRRLSSQPPFRPSATSPFGTNTSPFDHPSESPRAPSLVTERDEDAASSSPRNVAQDMISASTVAAGPSVQLVERMSAAIRRLEAEKVAAKEEMARVCSQRDEARTDMVGLMKDLEAAKSAAQRVEELETEAGNINARYQTTLEMLGEKSERVEELQADVQDVKAMYRELVERTVQ